MHAQRVCSASRIERTPVSFARCQRDASAKRSSLKTSLPSLRRSVTSPRFAGTIPREWFSMRSCSAANQPRCRLERSTLRHKARWRASRPCAKRHARSFRSCERCSRRNCLSTCCRARSSCSSGCPEPRAEKWIENRCPRQYGRRAPRQVAPRTAVERKLAELYARVLGVGQVAASDNFFALGGHSLLAARLLRSVRAEFEIDLPLRTMFEAPTVAELANRIERGVESAGPRLHRSSDAGPTHLSPEQAAAYVVVAAGSPHQSLTQYRLRISPERCARSKR